MLAIERGQQTLDQIAALGCAEAVDQVYELGCVTHLRIT